MSKKVRGVHAPPSRLTKPALAILALAVALPFGLLIELFG
jgi:hypothetical protein